MDAPAALKELDRFCRYLSDWGRLSGGQMKSKYGDNPMEGFNTVIRRSRDMQERMSLLLNANDRVSSAEAERLTQE
jgi:hypothetical protein